MNRTPFQIADAPHGPLRGDVYLPDTPLGAPVVIGCHGFKGFKDWGFWPETGRRLTGAGLALVTFNFSGSGIGENPTDFTEPDRFTADTVGKQLDDLGRVLDAVGRREIPLGGADVRKVGALGHSRGGGVALVRAGRDPRIRCLTTWAAVSTFRRFTDADAALWRKQGFLEVVNSRTGQVFRMGVGFLEDLESHPEAYDPVAAARRLRVPYLIVHGTRDDAVPPEEAQRLARAADPGLAKLMLVEGAGHTFGAAHPFEGTPPELDRVLTRTAEWFKTGLA